VETASKGSGTRAADEGGAVTWGGTLGAGATAGREGAVVRGGVAQRGWWRGGAKRGRAREWNGHTQGETREEGNKKEGAVLNPSYIHRLTTNTRRLHHVCLSHIYNSTPLNTVLWSTFVCRSCWEYACNVDTLVFWTNLWLLILHCFLIKHSKTSPCFHLKKIESVVERQPVSQLNNREIKLCSMWFLDLLELLKAYIYSKVLTPNFQIGPAIF
jgi:hypothetical protein